MVIEALAPPSKIQLRATVRVIFDFIRKDLLLKRDEELSSIRRRVLPKNGISIEGRILTNDEARSGRNNISVSG
jgi:hypothetical protein